MIKLQNAVFFLIIFFLIIATGGFIFQHVRKIKRTKLQQTNKKLTDVALAESLRRLGLSKNKISFEISTSRLSDVWGSGIMAYEYEVKMQDKVADDKFKEKLFVYLQEYAKQNHLISIGDFPVFVISDLWQEDEILKIDITYTANEKTINYLKDVSRVDLK